MNIAIALQAIVSVMWLIVIGLIVLAVVRATRGAKVGAISTTILVLAIVAAIITSISAGLVFIQPEERGVVISAVAPDGYRTQALQPGLNWIIPFLENVETYSIARQTYTMSIAQQEGQIQGDDSIAARTADGQEVKIDASVIYAVDPAQVIHLHIEWQRRYGEELVRPLSRGVIRDAVSQYGVEEVYSSRRAEMSEHPAQHHLLARIRRIRRAEADRRAGGRTGQVRRRASQAGGRTGSPGGQGPGRRQRDRSPGTGRLTHH
jgi:hypothetical protein